jgi:hypothetical protein
MDVSSTRGTGMSRIERRRGVFFSETSDQSCGPGTAQLSATAAGSAEQDRRLASVDEEGHNCPKTVCEELHLGKKRSIVDQRDRGGSQQRLSSLVERWSHGMVESRLSDN